MTKDSKIFVAGHRGLVGSAICRLLRAEGHTNIITATRGDVDLTDPVAVKWFFSSHQPEYVFLAAAHVGGIVGNSNAPVEFMLENLRIQDNVISNSKNYGVRKLLFLGSACAYPKHATNPIVEDDLLTGPLEPSNEAYALAKICGIRLCRAYRKQYDCDFISAMPSNLYGIGDHYDLTNSHVIPGMIRRMHEAKGKPSVTLWGTGRPIREFLYADDLARACWVLMNEYSGNHAVNITSGIPTTLAHLACFVARAVGFAGDVVWDTSKPDGTPARILDGTILDNYGWSAETLLPEGLKLAYEDFLCQNLG
jgi:GDP-L-fucose synthase